MASTVAIFTPDFCMPFVPLPFVVAILLIVLFVAVLRRDDAGQANKPFLALILVSAFLSLLSGLRWGYGIRDFMYLAPVAAATVPPLAYAGVERLVRETVLSTRLRIGLHSVPALLILVLMAVWQDAIDLALVLISVSYAVAILLLMRTGTDALRLAPFEGAAPAYRAILFAAVALLFSAAVDTFVFLDLAWTHGAYARPVIASGNLASLIILSIAAATASRSHTSTAPVEFSPAPERPDDGETIAAITALMQLKHAYRDVDLNLDRMPASWAFPRGKFQWRSTGRRARMFRNMSTSTGSPKPVSCWWKPASL